MADKKDDLKTLWDKIKDVRVAMLVTRESDGTLRSRPMGTLKNEDETPEVWFFTYDDSPKTDEVQGDQHVNLSYAWPEKEVFVSVSGKAKVVHDKEKAKELWNPFVKAWFPDGVDDPRLALLQISIEQAEYWDAPSNRMVQLAGIAKAIVTGGTYEPGENEKIDVAH